MQKSKKAIIIFSGGLDSTTCLALAKSQGFACYTLTFDYGQRHNSEVEAAKRIAKMYGVIEHRVFTLPINQWGGSALTDNSIAIPEHSDSKDIPITYVPARNTTFLVMALAWAEVLEAYDIFIGVNAIDYSHYPDCRPEYIEAFEKMANLATKAGVAGKSFKIHTPLITLSKAEIIQKGLELGIDHTHTVSCYQLNHLEQACGICDSCFLRKKGFLEAKIPDPTRYVD